MTRYSIPAHSLSSGALAAPNFGAFKREAVVPKFVVQLFLLFFVFAVINGPGLITTFFKESLPALPIAFGMTCVMVLPWTPSKGNFIYFSAAWVFWFVFTVGGFLGPLSPVGLGDYFLAQLILKLWISLVGLPLLTVRAINRDKLSLLLKTAIVAVGAGGWLAVSQLFYVPGRMAKLVSEPGRGAGFWINPNNCGEICAFTLFVSLMFPFKRKWATYFARLSLLAGLLSTLSRGAMVIMVAGFVVYGITAKKMRTVLQVGFVLGVVMLFMLGLVSFLRAQGGKDAARKNVRLNRVSALLRGDLSESKEDRLAIWRYGWDAVKRDFIFGRGHRSMENVVPVGGGLGPHNYYLYVWGNSGLMALLAFLGYMAALWLMSRRCVDVNVRSSLCAMTAMLAAVAMVSHSLINNVYFGPITSMMAVTAFYNQPVKRGNTARRPGVSVRR